MKFSTILLVVFFLNLTYGYNILVISPFPGTSHFMLFKTIMKGLLDRGHKVTCITNFQFKDDSKQFANYTEILVDPPFDMNSAFPPKLFFQKHDINIISKLFMVMGVGLITSEYAFKSDAVQHFMQDKNQKFDLVISEQFFQESFLMFAHKYNVPIISVCTFTYADYMVQSLGLRQPYSFVSHFLLDYTDDMSFFQRATNTFLSLIELAARTFWYLPQQNKIARKFFNDLEVNGNKLPLVEDLDNSKSLLLANTHLAFDRPQPVMPGMVNIGGIHITSELNKLPDNIQKFIDGAEHGVIYFSWGTVMNPKDLPKPIFEILLKTLSNLKQRIIWKYDGVLKNLPPNVFIQKWLPQKEILAHPNVKLFISHGGLFGTQESVYFGVPMFITPFFGDQHKNAKNSQQAGYALYSDFNDISYELLNEKLNELLTNDKYEKRAKELSAIFRDNLVHPLDETMYWIEYVARHKGANHLKSHARNLNIAQYYLWDVFAFVFATLVLMAGIMYNIMNQLVGKKKVAISTSVKVNNKKRKVN